jgi:hypothetical protein
MLAALTLYLTWYFDVAAAWLPCWGFSPGDFINELQMEEIAEHCVLL